ncbi:murein hydrolase activator EnvC family protein [Streptomyces sp. NPDC057743]|uniref:murein hydrolase activator EnvC family protein n=1 Tax=Streptomyces sp. NPDC057743 TaxID=3346236 RepID=UPI0036A0350D
MRRLTDPTNRRLHATPPLSRRRNVTHPRRSAHPQRPNVELRQLPGRGGSPGFRRNQQVRHGPPADQALGVSPAREHPTKRVRPPIESAPLVASSVSVSVSAPVSVAGSGRTSVEGLSPGPGPGPGSASAPEPAPTPTHGFASASTQKPSRDRVGVQPSSLSHQGGSRRPLLPLLRPLTLCALRAVCALCLCVLCVGASVEAIGTAGVADAASPMTTAPPPLTKAGAKLAARPAASTADRSWPVDGPGGAPPTVLRGWEPPPTPWAAGHRGVDLAAPTGAVVKAAAPGQITFAGTVAGRGVLTIEVSDSGHPPLHTTYEPVRASAHKGQQVAAGQPVGVLEGGPYHCRAPCLHWGLLRGTTYLNPLSLLPPAILHGAHSRLLPIFGIPEPNAVPEAGPPRPHREQPALTTHGGTNTSADATGAALLGALALAGAALWALGRLRGSTERKERVTRRGAASCTGSGKRRLGLVQRDGGRKPWRAKRT